MSSEHIEVVKVLPMTSIRMSMSIIGMSIGMRVCIVTIGAMLAGISFLAVRVMSIVVAVAIAVMVSM